MGQGGQGGYYPGDEEAMENPRGVSSSLPGHMCTGPCETLPGQTNFTCKIGVQPGRFACSQEVALRRTQIGSRTKLWCISGSDCAKQQDGVYRCRTMLGWDECSPSPAHDSQGNQCRDTCHEREVDGKAYKMGSWDVVGGIVKHPPEPTTSATEAVGWQVAVS